MLNFLDRNRKWLTAALVILLVLEVLTFPHVVGISFADRSENPNHTLTYTTGKLVWETANGVNEQGAAIFGIFDPQYANVESENGDYVVAPGTESGTVIRLINNSGKEITYRAVMYMMEKPEDLPVVGALDGENVTDTNDFSLPEGVAAEAVVRAVSGKVQPKDKQDFDLSWFWEFYTSDMQDMIDTWLGDQAAAGDPGTACIGFYLVVEEEEGVPTKPDNPKTGDSFHLWLYVGVMILSGLALAFMLLERIWERKRQC